MGLSSIPALFRRVFYGKDNEDAKLVQKIDLLIMTYACLTQFINILEEAEPKNLLLHYRDKDLHFKGLQYNYVNTLFLVGYTIGQVPSNIALTYISPRIWFTGMQFLWAILCLAQYAARNPQTVMGLRFVMGMAESSTFVGMHLIFGSWYTPAEIGKRAALFTSCAQIGSILSGFIQAGLYEHMNGTAGLKGWQWLYIVDFLVTLPVIVYGWFFFPDFPHNTTCHYLNTEEKSRCVIRIPNERITKAVWNFATLKRVFSSWQIYIFPLLFTLYGTGLQMTGNNTMPFFMKQHGIHDVVKLNYYPTGMTGTGILAMWGYALLSDWLKTKVPASIAIGATFIISGALCLSSAVPFGGKLFAFYLCGTTLAPQSLWYSWANV
ncbi:Pantothenate transporter liz1 [Lachnellula cervina]|uniref:Pantothenate transporter liz1 n=1 Tax=Lachnellula cervina TaxID=1316786 RepID=A0A7D8UXV6_9HELO|nr:Pantothenate transporter liz1 [Lachnellula cervina]